MAITKERAQEDGMLGRGNPELKGLEKIDWEDLEGQEITIKSFTKMTDSDGKDLYAVIPEEYPENFMWCGASLVKYILKYGEEFNGTVLIVGSKVKTKSGRYCRNFDIV